jgi:hypothetical protein
MTWRFLPRFLALCSLVAWTNAHAFWRDLHQVVATLAEAQLTPAARQRVTAILAAEPGATLASVSNWADEVRSPHTAAWHYVNFPEDSCDYVPERDCPGGRCVVSALREQAKLLAAGDAQGRLQALKFVVHLVADVHQPLHAAHATDKGGNLYQVHAFGRGTNLHALWDRGLAEALPGGARAILEELSGAEVARSVDLSFKPERWAEESCRIATSDGFYPASHKIGADYVSGHERLLKLRVAIAAARLAALLNAALK